LEADLELTAAIGAEVLVYHAGMLRDPLGDDDALAAGMAAEREHLRALGDKAGEKGVLIAVENVNPTAGMVARRAYGLRLDVLADQVSTVDHPRVSVCLDTGHAFLAARYLGYDFLGAIREIAPLVGHVHLTDNLGRVGLGDADLNERYATGDGDLHLPPGWGDIPFAEVFSVPFPREPTIILEMRSHFADHYAEALETTRKLQRLSSTSTTEALNLERPG
jgi:sugar phosphate isomerase/epimerase